MDLDHDTQMAELHERLAYARKRAGFKSPRAAAQRFGWNENTYKSRESGIRGTPISEARIYARALNVSLHWLLTGEGIPEIGKIPLASMSGTVPVSAVPVRGETAAGRWLEFEVLEQNRFPPVPTVPTKYPNAEQFAYRVSGSSMDRERILDGDFVVCVDYWVARAAIETGDIVVVERKRGSVIERTCKQVEVKQSRYELWPRSSDPRFQEPLVVSRDDNFHEDDGTTVEIVGLVVGRYSPIG